MCVGVGEWDHLFLYVGVDVRPSNLLCVGVDEVSSRVLCIGMCGWTFFSHVRWVFAMFLCKVMTSNIEYGCVNCAECTWQFVKLRIFQRGHILY